MDEGFRQDRGGATTSNELSETLVDGLELLPLRRPQRLGERGTSEQLDIPRMAEGRMGGGAAPRLRALPVGTVSQQRVHPGGLAPHPLQFIAGDRGRLGLAKILQGHGQEDIRPRGGLQLLHLPAPDARHGEGGADPVGVQEPIDGDLVLDPLARPRPGIEDLSDPAAPGRRDRPRRVPGPPPLEGRRALHGDPVADLDEAGQAPPVDRFRGRAGHAVRPGLPRRSAPGRRRTAPHHP